MLSSHTRCDRPARFRGTLYRLGGLPQYRHERWCTKTRMATTRSNKLTTDTSCFPGRRKNVQAIGDQPRTVSDKTELSDCLMHRSKSYGRVLCCKFYPNVPCPSGIPAVPLVRLILVRTDERAPQRIVSAIERASSSRKCLLASELRPCSLPFSSPK